MVHVDDIDFRLLAAIEDGLPLVPRPYEAVGARVGLSENDVMARLQAMMDRGVIRRFGLVLRHRELGFLANAMVVWDVPDAKVDAAAEAICRHDFITLCYRRRRHLPEWPYNLYCMVHGRAEATVRAQIARLARLPELAGLPHEILFSTRRFKQCGARFSAKGGKKQGAGDRSLKGAA